MALLVSFLIALCGGPPPTDTPGGPIVQTVPVVQTAGVLPGEPVKA
jgi:hypothetical protein